MEIEKILKELKNDCSEILPSPDFPKTGWKVLREEIEKTENQSLRMAGIFRYALLIFILMMIFSGSLVIASVKAKPGNLLYPVKVFSEKFINNLKKETGPEEKEIAESKKQSITPIPTENEIKKTQKENKSESLKNNSTEKKEEIKKVEEKVDKSKTEDTVKSVEKQMEQQIKEKMQNLIQNGKGVLEIK